MRKLEDPYGSTSFFSFLLLFSFKYNPSLMRRVKGCFKANFVNFYKAKTYTNFSSLDTSFRKDFLLVIKEGRDRHEVENPRSEVRELSASKR